MTSAAFQRLVKKFWISWFVAALAVLGSVLWGWREHSARQWPTVVGKVESRSSSYRRGKGAYMEYSYVVNGIQHQRRERFTSGESPQRMDRRITSGSKIVVHYNPANPSDATVKPGVGNITLIMGGLGLFWLLLFPCAWIDAVRRKKAHATALVRPEIA